MKKWMKGLTLVAFMIVFCLVPAKISNAAVVIPASGDTTGKTDYKNMMDGLETDGHIILEEGATYYTRTTLWVESNQSITATGATILCKTGAFRNKPTKVNYKSIQNFTVDGGFWKNQNSNTYKKTLIQLSHGSNITLKNMKVYCNYAGHAVELIACKNVTVDNCILKGVGKCSSTSAEEQLQIDIAAPKSAPTLANYGKKYVKGQICQNITVTNCTITGARGVSANCAKEAPYNKKFHKNIVLQNNTITGMSSEAVILFNVMGATVENNTIISKSERTTTAYSVGLHIAMFGTAPTDMKNAVYTVNNNTIKGGRQGFYVYSHSSSKFGKVIAKKNKCYAKAGKEKAIWLDKNSVRKSVLSKNKMYKWK
ncbi:MAG: right-handed parallel beta-helix repeat-containing protein [Lachnospiraceae bacterium]|nr:right-handed parallel beta-helix repeat-containing protein [Lachnospiraceae bacterium]